MKHFNPQSRSELGAEQQSTGGELDTKTGICLWREITDFISLFLPISHSHPLPVPMFLMNWEPSKRSLLEPREARRAWQVQSLPLSRLTNDLICDTPLPSPCAGSRFSRLPCLNS